MRDPYATWVSSPNFWPERMGYKPRYLIIHGTAGGSNASSVGWLCNTESQASAHYVITQDGKIYQLVDEEASAWGNGIITVGHDPWWTLDTNPNLITISIEHEKPDDGNNTPLAAAQSLASFQLVSRICQRWNIPARPADQEGGITGHKPMETI
jgi:N-acetyl-anhydromuramyl-L-alanine amidase AmpD